MKTRIWAEALIIALLVLVLAWQLWLAPPMRIPSWLGALLHALPLLPAVVLLVLRRRSAAFWGAVAALILFCHGVAEAWSAPEVRAPALAEVALSLLLVFAASWDGLRARFARGRSV